VRPRKAISDGRVGERLPRLLFLKISGTKPEFARFGLDGAEVHCRCSAFVANKVRRRRGAAAGFLKAANGWFSGICAP
jgi:hypothetical protein